MIEDVENRVDGCVIEGFKTMLNLQAQREPAGTATAIANVEPQVAGSVGSVGFIGRLTGVVHLYSTQTFARRMTSAMLGLADHAIEVNERGDERGNDVIGGLSNMVVGHIKSQLSDRGMPCELTIHRAR